MLVGPTASGKSDVALEVARTWPDVELVTADSMQVYRGMDIGTAKPTAAERAEVPHHLLDLVEPTDDFTVTRYQQAFAETLQGIEARGHRALVVGGTGLYVQAVVDDFEVPGRFPEVRADLEALEDTPALHYRLARLDPVAAGRMEPGNRRRVVRALEVTLGSGRPFSSFGPGLQAYPETRFLLAGLDVPRPVLAERIERRFHAMVAGGLLDEVRSLVDQHGSALSRTARQALGYRELLGHLEDGADLETAIAEAVRRTRHLARRQRSWFGRDPRIVWHHAVGNPVAVLPALLGDWASRCRS